MYIAILSDSHDHIPNLRAAVAIANEQGAAALIHCGDLISPFMLAELARFHGAVHCIYGNNVGDQHLISTMCAQRFPAITHHGVLGALEAGGLRIGFHHYPAVARGLAATGNFDVVCCGHNHVAAVEHVGSCLLVNPGELLGKDGQPTFAILDTTSRTVVQKAVGRPIPPLE